MIVRVRKAMDFTADYVALVHHLFASGGKIPGLSGSEMHSANALRQWMNKHISAHMVELSSRTKFEGAVFETNCFSLCTALTCMTLSAQQNVRCQEPALSFTLSWGAEDLVTDDAAFRTVRHCLQATGMDDLPYVAVVRRNAIHTWSRIVVSRVPEDGGRAVNTWRNVDSLQRARREAERLNDWKHEEGTWVIHEDEIIRPQERQR
jgi:hypothetical protein